MINLERKQDCCGCSACIAICPNHCISFIRDREGFLYPKINKDICTNCHLCKEVCPVLIPSKGKLPIKAFAAINNDDKIRDKSSSGGLFYLLAKKVIDERGVVFGARFNKDWKVIMDYAQTIEGIRPFMGSKYVQANPKNTYSEVKRFLKDGRKVLFTGTGCQISGLRNFLRRDYENLFLVDVICHGVPSPSLWEKYVSELVTNENKYLNSRKSLSFIKNISFRDKSYGWKNFRFLVSYSVDSVGITNDNSVFSSQYSKPFYEDPYFLLFLKNYTLRPSCYHCPAKKGRCGSDITIGDFWGIDNIMPQIDDDKGISACLVNTDKGMELFNALDIRRYPVDYKDVLKQNPVIEKSVKEPLKRYYVFRHKKYTIGKIERIITKGTITNLFFRKTYHFIKSGVYLSRAKFFRFADKILKKRSM